MNKTEIIRKLTSRKFWMSLASFVSMLLVYAGASENKAAQTASLIMAGASVIGYAIGEGLADSSTTDTEYWLDEDVTDDVLDAEETK